MNENSTITSESSQKREFKPWMLLVLAIVIVGIILAGAYIYVNKPKVVEKCPGQALTSPVAADRAIKYINQFLLGGQQTASLKEITEEGCLYKIKITINNSDFDTYMSRDGKLFFPEGRKVAEEAVTSPATAEQPKITVGSFSVNKDTVCKENDKPIIYFFGTSGCPHCKWEEPILEKVTKQFTGFISLHSNIDTTTDQNIFSKYSTGGVPTLVFGCKYSRVGSGENVGEAEETKVLTAVICKLTGNQPTAVCDAVKDLVSQISD